MANIRKFMFDTSFDVEAYAPPRPEPVPALEPEPEPEPPPPTFGEAELEAARAAAYADGVAAGRAEAEADIERRLADALTEIAGGLSRLLETAAEGRARRTEEAIRVAVAVVRKLHPELTRRGAAAEVEGVVGACLADLAEEPRVTVRVAADLLGPLSDRADALANERGFTGKLVVLADPALSLGDCRVEWTDGGAERSTERLWTEIEAIAARHLAARISPETSPTQGP